MVIKKWVGKLKLPEWFWVLKMERATGIEPATLGLGSRCSTG